MRRVRRLALWSSRPETSLPAQIVASSRTLIISGAGIAGLTTALALAHRGFRALILEQAEKLQETGAGLQLAPNATRILRELGVAERLKNCVVVPQALSVKNGKSGRETVRMPLGEAAEFRYGAPYWLVHRADLQAALLETANVNPDVELRLGERVDDFADHAHGLTVQVVRGANVREERGMALVGADGLWSRLRTRLVDDGKPHFNGRAAWRATLPAEKAPKEFREPVIHLWLGRSAHLVHYPVRGGALINIVAIAPDRNPGQSWSETGTREEVLRHFSIESWAPRAREFLTRPERWLKWSLHDRPAFRVPGRGPVTLVGDAAHPMLPFLAQGAAMAIEDAAILAQRLAESPNALAEAMRRYEGQRHPRIADVYRAVRRTGALYHLGGPAALARDVGMWAMGGEKLRTRYDWLYDWRAA